MPHSTYQVPTPEGSIFHIEITPQDFLSVDARGPRDVFSWTADCTPRNFMDLGRGTQGTAMIAINGSRHEDEIKSALEWADSFPLDTLETGCDFIRFDWDDSSLSFQVFTSEAPNGQITLVSASGTGLYLRTVQNFITVTGTPAVIREVADVIREAGGSGREDS
jgi:hypothetical protein